MTFTILILFPALALFGAAAGAPSAVDVPLASAPPPTGRMRVEYFFSAGCDECRTVKAEVLPEFQELLGEDIELLEYNILEQTNALRLAWLQEKLQVKANDRVSFFLNEQVYIGGLDDIRRRLVREAERLLLEGAGFTPSPPPQAAPDLPVPQPASPAAGHEDDVLLRRARSFTVVMVALAGLTDGFNPCAFTTLIFFVSLLVAYGHGRRALILVGVGFCTAVFLTYLLMGLGAFRLLQALRAYRLAGAALRWAMAAALVVLSVLSFRDAYRFRKTGSAKAVVLQLPARVRDTIHRVMRADVGARHLVVASCAIGVLVTLLESVCTGQLYLPTLIYVAGHQPQWSRAAGLLVLYNLMFVAPHLVVFVAAYKGLTNDRLLAWSRGNVVAGKLALGAVFAALAVLLAAFHA